MRRVWFAAAWIALSLAALSLLATGPASPRLSMRDAAGRTC